MSISRKTYAELARALTSAHDHAELDALFFEHGFSDPIPGDSKLKRSVRFVQHLEGLGRESNNREALDIAQSLLSRAVHHHTELRELLRIDGFEFRDGRLVPTTPGAAVLAPQLSALEVELSALGYSTASKHYQQAIDNFTHSNWEASNGQLRAFIEDLIPAMASKKTGTLRDNVQAALQDLKNAGTVDDAEFNQVKAFWSGIQDNGPHAGLSSESEALFRLHVGTCIARYLLEKCA